MSQVLTALFLVFFSESHRPYLEITYKCIITSNLASRLVSGMVNELNQFTFHINNSLGSWEPMFLNISERALTLPCVHITSSAAPVILPLQTTPITTTGVRQGTQPNYHSGMFANTVFLFIIEIFLLCKKNTTFLDSFYQIPYFLGSCEYIESSVFNLTWKRCFPSKFLFPNAIHLSKS